MIRFIGLLIIFLLIGGGGGIYFVLWRNPLTILLLVLSIIYSIYAYKRMSKDNFNASLITLVMLSLFLLINYINAIPGQSIHTYIYATLTLVIAFFLNISLRNKFLSYFYKVLQLYKYQALFSFLIVLLFNNYFQIIIIDENTSYYTLLYLFFHLPEDVATVSVGMFTFIRNQGLFWEPGILQLFMNVLLFLEFFYFKASFKKIALTITVIISTFSTVGLLIMSLLVIIKYKSLLKNKKSLFLLPVFLIFLVTLYPIVNANIEDKFYGDHETSSQVRLFDALQSFEMIKDYPWSGIGITIKAYNDLQNKQYYNISSIFSYEAGGNTNSILAILVMYGIPIGFVWFVGLYRQTLIEKQKVLFFIVLVLGLLSEPLLYRLFFVFFVFNGLSNFISKKLYLKGKIKVTESLE